MRKSLYLVIVALVGAGLYFFIEKKKQEPVAPVVTAPAVEEHSAAPHDVTPSTELAAAPAESASPAAAHKLTDFTLTDQTGKEFHSSAMKGQVFITSFFFSTCQGPCPLMNKKMEALQETFSVDANIKLVSITVDSEHDTSEVLKTYSETFKANPEKWFFLTGSKDVIHDVMTAQMKLGGADDKDTHSTRFVLVDKEGTIKGYYDSTSEEELSKLVHDARELANVSSAS